MSMPWFFEPSLVADGSSTAHAAPRPDARNPLVSFAVAMTVAGCLIATADPSDFLGSALLGSPWAVVFICVAIEQEVRRYDVPSGFSLLVLLAQLGFVGIGHGGAELLLCVAGAIAAPVLLLPLYFAGATRRGTLFASATFGAIAGAKAIAVILLLAALIGIPFAALRMARNANLQTLPVLVSIGFAMAAYPLL